jgi:hypothetical protein
MEGRQMSGEDLEKTTLDFNREETWCGYLDSQEIRPIHLIRHREDRVWFLSNEGFRLRSMVCIRTQGIYCSALQRRCRKTIPYTIVGIVSRCRRLPDLGAFLIEIQRYVG